MRWEEDDKDGGDGVLSAANTMSSVGIEGARSLLLRDGDG